MDAADRPFGNMENFAHLIICRVGKWMLPIAHLETWEILPTLLFIGCISYLQKYFFSIPYSLFPIPCSLFPVPCSLFPVP